MGRTVASSDAARSGSPSVAVLVVAYNAETTLAATLDRIPDEVWELAAEVCLFDDASADRTYEVGLEYRKRTGRQNLSLFQNPVNLGYGGNQKLAYRYAIGQGHDIGVLLHGDGQYAPEIMMTLVDPLLDGTADAVLGSRMLRKTDAIKGGMPLYKFVGNRVLTEFANSLLAERFSEYHTGYRAYDLHALADLPLERNTDDFHFDTQVIIQLLAAHKRIVEVPIPTFYGDEECHVDGIAYARNVVSSVLQYKLHCLGLAHRPEYDLSVRDYPARTHRYELHERMAMHVPPGSRVLEVGCEVGHLTGLLVERNCVVHGIDPNPGPMARSKAAACFVGNFHRVAEYAAGHQYDRIVLADVLEHIEEPEKLLRALRPLLSDGGRILASTGNVAHWFVRFSLLAGRFHYTPRGILDSTHLRLYTPDSFAQLLSDSGYRVVERDVAVLPIEELHRVLSDGIVADGLRRLAYVASRAMPGLMAYQTIVEAEPVPDPLDAVSSQKALLK
ncbi:MAG: methyltransferase domain-containing protein [Deltaproteobacteria bacterium]|nr:methyltransferase domain-containing protein [Deltaproteobacteria bacterium]